MLDVDQSGVPEGLCLKRMARSSGGYGGSNGTKSNPPVPSMMQLPCSETQAHPEGDAARMLDVDQSGVPEGLCLKRIARSTGGSGGSTGTKSNPPVPSMMQLPCSETQAHRKVMQPGFLTVTSPEYPKARV